MILRKLGAVLRGKATPFQLGAACVLGAMLGFVPGLYQAPALVVLLTAALLFLNASLGLALFVAGGAKLLSLVAAPLSVRIGAFLLEGPTAGLARGVVNAPVLAWCGLDYYAVTGGQVLGLAGGAILALCVTRTVARFRLRMLATQDEPSRLRALAGSPVARTIVWLCLGGTGKKSWEQKVRTRVGNPVRIWGAVLLVLLVVGAYWAQERLAGPLARRGLQAGLERANGATVDVGDVQLELDDARLAVLGLALADPHELGRDLFRAELLEIDVDQADIARRRLHVARVVVRNVESGTRRERRGELVERAPEPAREERERSLPDPRDLELEDVVLDYETWRARLAQARDWLRVLAGDGEESGEPTGGELRERLEERARQEGWFALRADDLLDGAPALRLSELVVDGISVAFLPGRILDLRASELSTHPERVDAPPRLALASRDGDLRFEVDLSPVSRAGGDGALRVAWKGLSVDDVLAELRLPGPAPLRGGTLDLELDGSWDEGRIGWIDLPLRVTFHDTLFHVQGIEPTSLDGLVLPIELRGPIDAPRVRFDSSTFLEAVTAAGKAELADRLRGLAAEELDALVERTGLELPGSLAEGLPVELPDELPSGLTEGLGEKLPEEATSVLGGLFGRDGGDGR